MGKSSHAMALNNMYCKDWQMFISSLPLSTFSTFSYWTSSMHLKWTIFKTKLYYYPSMCSFSNISHLWKWQLYSSSYSIWRPWSHDWLLPHTLPSVTSKSCCLFPRNRPRTCHFSSLLSTALFEPPCLLTWIVAIASSPVSRATLAALQTVAPGRARGICEHAKSHCVTPLPKALQCGSSLTWGETRSSFHSLRGLLNWIPQFPGLVSCSSHPRLCWSHSGLWLFHELADLFSPQGLVPPPWNPQN